MATPSPQCSRKSLAHPSPENIYTRRTWEISPPPIQSPHSTKGFSTSVVPDVTPNTTASQQYPSDKGRPLPSLPTLREPERPISSPPHMQGSPASRTRSYPRLPSRQFLINPAEKSQMTEEARADIDPDDQQRSHTSRSKNYPRTPPRQFLIKPNENMEEFLTNADQQAESDPYPRPSNPVPPPLFLQPHVSTPRRPERQITPLPYPDHIYPYSRDSLIPQVERIRGSERSSSKLLADRQQRRQLPLREGLKSRGHQTISVAATFAPEPRSLVPYDQHGHSSPETPLPRRVSNVSNALRESSFLSPGQTRPLRAMSAKPDRSRLVQEEPTGEVPSPKDFTVAHDPYGSFRGSGHSTSLTPLLDPNPAVIAGGKADSLAHSGRDGGEDDDGDTLLDSDDEPIRLRAVQAPPDKEEGYTPPSPQSSMPADTTMESDQHPRYGTVNVRPRDGSDTHVVRTSSVEETVAPRMSRSPSSNLPPGAREPDLYPCYDSAPVGRRGGKEVLTPCSLQPCETMEGTAGIIRPRTRNASTDQLAMRSFALSMFAQSDGLGLGTPDLGSPPQYVEQRCFNTESQWDDQQHRPYEPRTTRKPDARSRYTQLNNVQHPTAQSFSSHCPDAPGMLPTPIASPLPSPLVRNASFIDPFTSTTPAGSPYPCPSNHVRRNHSSQNTSRASVSSPTFDANGTMHRSLTIQEQPVRQWQYNHSQSAVEEGASTPNPPAVSSRSSTNNDDPTSDSSQSTAHSVSPSRILVYQNLYSFLHEVSSTLDPLINFTLRGLYDTMSAADSVLAIAKSRASRSTLLQVASKLGVSLHNDLREALHRDEEQIATYLVTILSSKSAKEAVLLLAAESAQFFLDVVQETLDRGLLMEPEHNSKARRIVLRLSHAHDNLPSSLFIAGVRNRDLHPSFGGGFGEVYRASYAGKTVALKHMRTFHRGPESRRICWQFCREALVWQNLKHPNILPLIGIDRESFPSLCMVSPWMEHGTIMKYLNDHGRERVDKLLCEIAQGLQYLHSHNIVHGDLRGANILVTHDWSACLADFGLATLTDATMPMFPTSSRAGSVRWMAPELLSPEHFGLEFRRTAATDVYAFGSVCIELYTGRAPFAEVSEGTALLKIIDGEKPKRPTTMDDVLWHYVNNYLGRYPATRPHIDVVFQNMVIIRLQLAELCAGAAAPQIRFSVR